MTVLHQDQWITELGPSSVLQSNLQFETSSSSCLTRLQNQPSYFKSRHLRDLSDFPILAVYILDIYCKAKFCCHKCFFSFFGTINLSVKGDLIVTNRIRFYWGRRRSGSWGVESPQFTVPTLIVSLKIQTRDRIIYTFNPLNQWRRQGAARG